MHAEDPDGDGTTRREIMSGSLAVGAGLALGAGVVGARMGFAEEGDDAPGKAAKPLKILVLGGTGWLGPAAVRVAVARGHTVTLFNRGKTNPHLFPDLEKLRGDRNTDLSALEGRTWDAVIDTAPYTPPQVTKSAGLLKDAATLYVLISSISVYAGFGNSNEDIDEDAPVIPVPEGTDESKMAMRLYGPFKARCEEEAEKAFPGRACNIRPGLIVGPGDKSFRYSYWPMRMRKGGEVLAPEDRDADFQVIDVRDLGAWMIHCVENNVTGVYNACGFKGRVRMDELLGALKCELNTEATLTWVSEAFLQENKVRPWAMWMPRDVRPYVENNRAIEKGLTFRPITETSRDILDWVDTDKPKTRWMGPPPEREAELLKLWHEQQKDK